ncbi:hypothetical protein SCHPADRAFT_908349 [Schizopora paradoxa]|uniref:MYND-type domain-containing protein n=1 Tax=Schizopora paradoxa TaxID=27342 RepID=A0A0H2RVA7_9AGAM|nr:hypothetical protein SCHPADRAFT_908349 [Schizopora paradoxa]
MLLVRDNILTFPAKLQTEAFEVFCYHLRKPVDQQRLEKKDPHYWITESLTVIRKLGWAFFDRDPVSKKRFVECWPHIFKWMKALLKVRLVIDRENQYSAAVGEIYHICRSVYPNAFREDEVIEFAIQAWIGIEIPDGEDCFTARALLTSLETFGRRSDTDYRRFDQALQACNATAEDLVNLIVSRLKWEMLQSSSMNLLKVFNISRMLATLMPLHRSYCLPFLKSSPARCFVAVLKALMDHKEPSLHRTEAIRTILTVMCASLFCQTIEYALYIMEEGILDLLPRVASSGIESEFASKSQFTSMATDILNQLLLRLACDPDMIQISFQEVEKLFSGNSRMRTLVNTTPKKFRDTWNAFEDVLLENTIVMRLIERGCAGEDSICFNRECRKLAPREEFKKCSGCFFALYCSTSCQTSDWKSHRAGCKTIEGNFLAILRNSSFRFTRRMHTMHVNRHWSAIVRLARKKGIPLSDIAVRISCDKFPFKTQVFDYHTLLEHKKESPHLALAAKEELRQSKEKERGSMVVVLHILEMDYPFIVHANKKWTRAVSNPPPKTKDQERSSFVDEDGNELLCKEVDAVCAAIRLTKKYASEEGTTVWDKVTVHRAVSESTVDFLREVLEGLDFFKQESNE